MRSLFERSYLGLAAIGLGILMLLWAFFRAHSMFGWDIFQIVNAILSCIIIALGFWVLIVEFRKNK